MEYAMLIDDGFSRGWAKFANPSSGRLRSLAFLHGFTTDAPATCIMHIGYA
jgi:hypothetical protein